MQHVMPDGGASPLQFALQQQSTRWEASSAERTAFKTGKSSSSLKETAAVDVAGGAAARF